MELRRDSGQNVARRVKGQAGQAVDGEVSGIERLKAPLRLNREVVLMWPHAQCVVLDLHHTKAGRI